MGRRQAVRHGILIPAYPGSNPGAPAKSKWAALRAEIYAKRTARRQDENRKVRLERAARENGGAGPAGVSTRRMRIILAPQPNRWTEV